MERGWNLIVLGPVTIQAPHGSRIVPSGGHRDGVRSVLQEGLPPLLGPSRAVFGPWHGFRYSPTDALDSVDRNAFSKPVKTMKNRLLPLAFAGLAVLLGTQPAAAQKSYGGRTKHSVASKSLNVHRPATFGSNRLSSRRSSSSNLNASYSFGKQKGFGVSYSKPGFSVNVGTNFGHHKPARVWIPGAWSSVPSKVWVPAKTNRVWYDPIYSTRYDSCGRPYRVLSKAGYYKTVQVAGYYSTQSNRKWIAGHWSY